MNIFRKWWKKPIELPEWVHGLKHPDTPVKVFKNVWGYDLVRRTLPGRCAIDGYVVSNDFMKVKEMMFRCDNPECECQRIGNERVHQVCELCYDMYHALYVNYSMKNRNYFREIDNEEKRQGGGDWRNKRDKLGL